MIINLNGVEYVEKNYDKIIFSKWSPKAFSVGFLSGFTISLIMIFAIMGAF